MSPPDVPREDLPTAGLWGSGLGRRLGRGKRQRSDPDISGAEGDAVSDVLRQDRIALWKDLWDKVEAAEAEVKRLNKEIVVLKKKLAPLVKADIKRRGLLRKGK